MLNSSQSVSSYSSTEPTGKLMSSSVSSTRSPSFLPLGYEPGNWDVICQRGKDCHEHVGNQKFRVVVDNHVDEYLRSKTRQDKSLVITKIIRVIEDNTSGEGGFVMKDPKSHLWYQVETKVSRDKVGNALRDAIKLRTCKSKSLSSNSNPFPREQRRDLSLMWATKQFIDKSTRNPDEYVNFRYSSLKSLSNAQPTGDRLNATSGDEALIRQISQLRSGNLSWNDGFETDANSIFNQETFSTPFDIGSMDPKVQPSTSDLIMSEMGHGTFGFDHFDFEPRPIEMLR